MTGRSFYDRDRPPRGIGQGARLEPGDDHRHVLGEPDQRGVRRCTDAFCLYAASVGSPAEIAYNKAAPSGVGTETGLRSKKAGPTPASSSISVGSTGAGPHARSVPARTNPSMGARTLARGMRPAPQVTNGREFAVAESETAMVVHESAAMALWGTNDPGGMIARMTSVADAMNQVVRKRGLFTKFEIKGVTREYVNIEGWSLVGAMVGVFPHPAGLEEVRLEDGSLIDFRAYVELVTRDGTTVGSAFAICTHDEPRWADRDWNQIASMAQTRATAKAYRLTLGFIMPISGFEATPAEEMSDPEPGGAPRVQTPRAPRPARPTAPARAATRPATAPAPTGGDVDARSRWWRVPAAAAMRQRGVRLGPWAAYHGLEVNEGSDPNDLIALLTDYFGELNWTVEDVVLSVHQFADREPEPQAPPSKE